MQLLVTEKPSVASAICNALGISDGTKHDGYIEGKDIIATWCKGHLVEMADPESYDLTYKKWSCDTLPIIPGKWKYRIKQATKKQYSIVKSLMKRDDIDSICNCCDAGREGELIFRLVYQEAGCDKPVKRLWISSMEEGAIKYGMENLLPGDHYDSLYAAALCRAKADWLIGMNGTRLFSCIYRGKVKKVGRVQTPTLAMIVKREAEIKGFKKTMYYVAELQKDGLIIKSDRFTTKEEAEEALKRCEGKPITVTGVTKKEIRTAPPKLFDLTTLQREANKVFGFTAKQTLDYLQSLYEKKLVTYPRTDSRFLTEDMASSAANMENLIKGITGWGDENPDIKRILDSKKVSDHHAVIPTPEIARAKMDEIPDAERKILELVMLRVAEATSTESVSVKTDIALDCAGTTFHTSMEEQVKAGFKAYTAKFKEKYVKNAQSGKAPGSMKEQLSCAGSVLPSGWDGTVKEDPTKPPAYYTESTLLSAMEKAGADETTKDAERRGLGTPATRADIIEKLVHDGYVKRIGKKIQATEDGIKLISYLPDRIKSPSYTAEWENRLAEIAKGETSAHVFMECIETEVKQMVAEYSTKDTGAEKGAAV